MEVNIELRLNVDEQPHGKTLKATRTPRKNRPVCVTCKQALALKNGCKKIIKEEHTILW